MKILPRTSAAVLASALFACSGGAGKSDEQTAAPAAPAAPAAMPADTEIVAATPAADVSGAFLVDCNDFESLSAIAGGGDSDTVGCLFKDKAAQSRLAVPPADAVLEVTLDDGTLLTPSAIPTGETVGWHYGFNIAKADRARVKSLVVKGKDPAGAVVDGKTDGLSYDYTKDPAFGVDAVAWIELATEVLFEMFREKPVDCKPSDFFTDLVEGAPKDRVSPLPTDFLAQDFHIAFTTAQRAQSGGGIAEFDRKCQEAGASIDQARTWKAVVSTNAEDAKDRIKIVKPVFNSIGFIVARNAAEFFELDTTAPYYGRTGCLDSPACDNRYPRYTVPETVAEKGVWLNSLYSECGLRVQQAYLGRNKKGEPFGPAMTDLWTGSSPGGGKSPNGSCEDWTSKNREVRGQVGRVYAGDQTVFARLPKAGEDDDSARRCSMRAFLLCVSI